jgi:phosphoribosyl 1,2-cyclic phosphodiesterase
MKVTFWGTRGSLPAPLSAAEFRSKTRYLLQHARPADCSGETAADEFLNRTPLPHTMTFGGNTPCVEVSNGNDFLILDCGSGLRVLGQDIMNRQLPPGARIHILQTHTHWDHIMGFPFFAPALSGRFEIHIHGVHPNLRKRFEDQMDRIHFPIVLTEMKSPVEFHQLKSGEVFTIGPFRIGNSGLHHPGGSYAYRISTAEKSVVFATDGEYTNREDHDLDPYVNFYRDADMLIFDAMYPTLEQLVEKMNYGHSTPVIGIDIALAAGVKTLVLFHHDPECDDARIADSFFRALDYLNARKTEVPSHALTLVTSYDGMRIEV